MVTSIALGIHCAGLLPHFHPGMIPKTGLCGLDKGNFGRKIGHYVKMSYIESTLKRCEWGILKHR
jgi:hypothetical protein